MTTPTLDTEFAPCGTAPLAVSASTERARDLFGYHVTTADETALEPWTDVVCAFLAHAAALPEKMAAVLERDADFALCHLCKGYFMLLLGRTELIAEARAALTRVSARRESLNERERAYLDGLALYLQGRITAAADLLDDALTRFPRDAVMIKLVHALRFVIGDAAGMRRSLEAVLPAIDRAHPSRAYVRGCFAFALEETGAYCEAERIGREAVAMRHAPGSRDLHSRHGWGDAWGLHAVAHVLDTTNRATAGVAWITSQPEAWAHCNNFGYHVWWHLALFHLDRGETAEVLRLYDQKIRIDRTDDYRDHSNAASLLTRLELDGVDVGDRWEELADLGDKRADDGCVVFADLHYMLALARDGRDDGAARILARLRAASDARIDDMSRVSATAGLPAAQGLHAFAMGDYAAAYAHLDAARPAMPSVGGSWAQRDVFERVTIDAALRAGLLTEAQARLQERLRRRGALDHYAETRLSRISSLRAAQARVALQRGAIAAGPLRPGGA